MQTVKGRGIQNRNYFIGQAGERTSNLFRFHGFVGAIVPWGDARSSIAWEQSTHIHSLITPEKGGTSFAHACMHACMHTCLQRSSERAVKKNKLLKLPSQERKRSVDGAEWSSSQREAKQSKQCVRY